MNRSTLARHRHGRGRLSASYGRTSAEGGGGTGGAGSTGGTDTGGAGSTGGTDTGGAGDTGKTYTKAEVEDLITKRLERDRAAVERQQQRANATESDRIAALERQLEEERTARRRTSVAAKHGLTDLEDLLGSGTDDELEERAKRLTARLSAGGGDGKGGRGRQTGSSNRPGGANRTVRETGGTALTPKQQAVQALRGLRGGTSSADD